MNTGDVRTAGGTGPASGLAAGGARMVRPDFPAWVRQVARTGGCSHPVRLRGAAYATDTATGEVLAAYSSADQPDNTLLVACGDRRASVCPACAESYRRDSWYLVAGGLRGGQLARERDTSRAIAAAGHLPDLSGHPMMWATLTAPSFGVVHRAGSWCRPRRNAGRCEHGVPLACNESHGEHDALVGSPLCVDCYDYAGAVVWNAAARELWRRTVIYTYRAAARLASGLTGDRLTTRSVRKVLRLSYVRVVEWQRRGVIHLHLAARLDGVDAGDPSRVVRPPSWADAGLLIDAFGEAVEKVSVPLPGRPAAVWGAQIDVQEVTPEQAEQRAGYIAKYACKSAGDTLAGLPTRPLRPVDVAVLRSGRGAASDHVRHLALTALELANRREYRPLRLGVNAHQAGWGGHYLTRSRWWSSTRRELRAVRRGWAVAERAEDGDPWGLAVTSDRAAVVGDWAYTGSGYSPSDAEIVENLRHEWATAREELRTGNAAVVSGTARSGWAGAALKRNAAAERHDKNRNENNSGHIRNGANWLPAAPHREGTAA